MIAHHPELVRRASHVDEVEQQLRAVALRIRGLHAAVSKCVRGGHIDATSTYKLIVFV